MGAIIAIICHSKDRLGSYARFRESGINIKTPQKNNFKNYCSLSKNSFTLYFKVL
jgi:hypothetical protein